MNTPIDADNFMERQNLDTLADRVADLIINAGKVVVFTGAGVSTESGIPDFRSPGGIWERFDPEDFTYQKFISDPEARRKHWRMPEISALRAPCLSRSSSKPSLKC